MLCPRRSCSIIHWFGNVWKMLFFRSGIDWKLILGFGVPGIFAGVLGGWLSQMVDTVLLIRFIGFFLLAYVAFLMFEPSFKLPKKMGTSIAGGLSSGFLAGLTGVGGNPEQFLSAFDLPKAKFIFTAGAIGFFIDSSRVGRLPCGRRDDGIMAVAGPFDFFASQPSGGSNRKKNCCKNTPKTFQDHYCCGHWNRCR
jgi:uncharacterized membrane protein YfcA